MSIYVHYFSIHLHLLVTNLVCDVQCSLKTKISLNVTIRT